MLIEREPAGNNLFSELEAYHERRDKLQWQGTFREYVEKVIQNPGIVRTAHQYLYQAITSKEDFFQTGNNALFGLEETIARLMEALQGAATGLEIRKRIFLLMGPPGSGKSTLVNSLKRAIEEYSLTDEGALYAIADCPMHEEPLHLIPPELRSQFEQNFGVNIEGSLCPHCNERYGTQQKIDQLQDPTITNILDVPVRRIILSEDDRIGIGTFKPSDPKSQDITELVGSVDLAKLGEYGTASDVRAYRFDGELNVANRGIMEFVELLKSDERFLYVLLDLAQDRQIKAPRFPNIYADEVIIAHTNETEYKAYVTNDRNEALRDRMLVIPVPYNLRVSDEIRVYSKLLSQSERVRKSQVHINPHTLEIAAMFAVLSRISPSKKPNVSKIGKMRIYDGQEATGLSQRDIRELREEAPREGMFGISPRYVIDALSLALIQEGRTCLTPIETLRALRDSLDYHPHTRDMKKEEKESILNDLALVKAEYDEIAKKEVQSAFVYSYEDSAQSLFENYLDNVEASVNNTKKVDPITQEEVEPDEQLMRSIEEQIGITETAKFEFRREILVQLVSSARRGQRFEYSTHPRLREAIERKLFADMKDIVRLTTSAKVPDKEQQERLSEVSQTLIQERGYCPHCANEMIRYVGTLLAK